VFLSVCFTVFLAFFLLCFLIDFHFQDLFINTVPSRHYVIAIVSYQSLPDLDAIILYCLTAEVLYKRANSIPRGKKAQ
jgi:hypothetical protein